MPTDELTRDELIACVRALTAAEPEPEPEPEMSPMATVLMHMARPSDSRVDSHRACVALRDVMLRLDEFNVWIFAREYADWASRDGGLSRMRALCEAKAYVGVS